MDDSEYEYIKEVASKNEISEEELLEIKENIKTIRFVEPKNATQRFQLIFDLVWMMMIDGSIDGERNPLLLACCNQAWL